MLDFAATAVETVKVVASSPPLEVKSTAGILTATGIWVAIIGAVGVALKIVPDMYGRWAARDKDIREDKREDQVSNSQRISALEDRMGRTTGALTFLANAVTVSVNALSFEDHTERARAAAHARELVALAASTLGAEDPFTKALDRMVGENYADHGKKP